MTGGLTTSRQSGLDGVGGRVGRAGSPGVGLIAVSSGVKKEQADRVRITTAESR